MWPRLFGEVVSSVEISESDHMDFGTNGYVWRESSDAASD